MLRVLVIIAILAAIVAVPFLLRPAQPPAKLAEDTLIIVTPHNEAIRHEFELGFASWYRARTGRTVAIDWRMVGGTSDIARYLAGQYVGSFRNFWIGALGRGWSAAVQSGFQDGRLPKDAPAEARAAREAFLKSGVSCGIDVFFGGGVFDFERQALAGTLVDSGVQALHPDWFEDDAIPRACGGEPNWDPQGRWIGCVLSSYGIIFNRDALRRLGFAKPPGQWTDLADPRYFGQVALADPTKSGSVAEAFENIMQQRIWLRLAALRAGETGPFPEIEPRAVQEGWIDGLRLLQAIGANSRYFTDSSQKIPIDVANGDCAAGLCIDFYGRQQDEALRRRGEASRLGFATPAGGSAYSADPVALLRGAPHPAAAKAFIEFVLSMDGQKLWNFKTGSPGGPRDFALRRLPVRRDFYSHDEWKSLRSDPDADPYAGGAGLEYRPEWTAGLFRELALIVRIMDEDTHAELAQAWRSAMEAPEPRRSRALAAMQDVSSVDYDRAGGGIRRALESKDQADEVRLARDLAENFRRQYARAEAIALGD